MKGSEDFGLKQFQNKDLPNTKEDETILLPNHHHRETNICWGRGTVKLCNLKFSLLNYRVFVKL